MEKKIDEIREHIFEIKLDLREHMRRTSQNEEMIKLLRQELQDERDLNDPVRRAFIGAKWSISAIVVACTIITVLVRIFK